MEKERKRYLFFGNMNNIAYVYAREMKNRGLDVTLILNAPRCHRLDRPEFYDSSLSYPLPEWIIEMPESENLTITKLPYLPFIKDNYLKLIADADIVILNGVCVSLGAYIEDTNKKVIALLAGEDLDVNADYNNINKLALYAANKISILFLIYPILLFTTFFIIFQQRRGIRRAIKINYFPTGIIPRADQILQQIMSDKIYERLELRGFPFNDIKYNPFKEKEYFFILNFTRFLFKDLSAPANKRNDIMIQGIAKFIKENKIEKNKIKIVFFNKGVDVPAAKELIEQLEITKFIEWQEPVSQMGLNQFIVDCDVTFDQLGNQWIGYGIVSMAMGRPLIANGRPKVFEKLTQEVAPVCQAINAEEVAAHLTYLYKNPSKKEKIGLKSRKYIIKHYNIDKTVDFLIN